MSKRNKKLVKILTAASLAASLAFCTPCTQLGAYAATAVTDGVMIRNDATTEAGIIGSLNEGDEVTILDVLQSGDGYAWYYIQLENGNKGYVRSDLISADDSELAAFKPEETEAPPQEEAPAEPEEETQPAEQPQEEAPVEAATAATPETEETVTTAQGYDAYSDPSANIVARFETDENGEGNWYVFNDDNGTRIKIRDLRDTEAAPAATGTPGIWRPLAIVFGILALAFAALALYLIKSIQDSRTKSSRRRTAEAVTEDADEEEDEFYFEDDEPEAAPDYEDEEEALEEESSDGSEMTAYLKEKCSCIFVNAEEVCRPFGSTKFFNIIMLGVAAGSGHLGLEKDTLLKQIEQRVPSRFLDVNLRAFQTGIEIAGQAVR